MAGNKKVVDEIMEARAAWDRSIPDVTAAALAKDGSMKEARPRSRELFRAYEEKLNEAVVSNEKGVRRALVGRAIRALASGKRDLAVDLINAARGRRKS